jgi:protoheme IX farnesyltransferase
VAILLMLAGLYVLASIGTNTGALLLLSGFAVLWYNGVYAYLKRVTAFAVVPGALIGAIPPVIGYLAAGGSFASPLVLLMGTFFFVWQIPHFWLLLLMCGSQYDDAGLPVLTRVFSPRQLLRITFMWLIATAAAGLVFPTMAHADLAIPWNLAIVVASFWLVSKAVSVLRSPAQAEQQRPLRRAFVQVNVYALIIMVCLSLNALQTATN